MTTSLSRWNKSSGGVLLVLTLLSGGAFAVELTWKPETGGALDDDANWEVTSEKDADIRLINKSQSGDLTLNGDWPIIGELWFRSTASTLNLGAGKTLSCTVLNFYSDTDVRLTSGTLTASGEQRVGNSSNNSRFVIDGPDARYVSTFTSKQLTLGHTAESNRLEVLNGATFVSPVRIGYNGASQNTLLVSGQGTVWSNTTSFVTSIGTSNNGSTMTSGNSLILADGAEMVNGDIRLGYVAGSWGNSLVLSGGAKMTGSLSKLRLGADGKSWGNSIIVADGSTLPLDVALPYTANSVSNTLVLSGAGTTWDRGSSTLYIGGKSGADYTSFVLSNGVEFTSASGFQMSSDAEEHTSLSEHNRILVASGAKLTVPSITLNGNNNTIEVTDEGSTLSGTASFYFPKDGGGATNCTLRIADGGKLTVPSSKSFYVSGGAGTGLDLDGGTIDIDGEIDIGSYSKGPTYSRVRNGGVLTRRGTSKQFLIGLGEGVHDTVLEVSDGGVLRLTDSSYFRIDHSGGYGNTLIVDNGTFDATNATVYIGEVKYKGDVPPENGDRIIVRNGGIMNCAHVTVGMGNPYSRFEVENSQVNILNNLLVSEEETTPSASDAVLRLAGTNVSVVVGNRMTLTPTATLIVDVTGPQVAEAMLTAKEYKLRAGARILITSSTPFADDDPTFRATVLKCTGGDIDFSKVTIEVDPNCGLRRRNSAANALVVGHRKKEGFAVIVR